MKNLDRYILIRAYVNGNLGDDLFVRILCDRYPNSNFILIGSKKYRDYYADINNLSYLVADDFRHKVLEKLKNVIGRFCDNYKLENYRRSVEMYASMSQEVKENILISGSYFIEWTRNRKYWKNYFEEESKYYSMKPIIMGINFGPYETQYYYDSAVNLLKEGCFLSVRERKTMTLLSSLKPVYAPDIVFTLNRKIKKEEKKYITLVVVNEKCCTQKYVKVLAAYMNKLLKQNYFIKIICFCKAEGDVKTADKLLKNIEDTSRVDVIVYSGVNLDEILSTIANSQLLIAGRYHAMILGWLYGINVIPICYSQKMINVINDLFPDTVYFELQDIEKIDDIDVTEIKNIVENSTMEKIISFAQENFRYLDNLLEELE